MIRVALRLLGVILLALAAPALAHGPDDGGLAPACHAYADSRASAAIVGEANVGWICGNRDWQAIDRHAFLRFELGEGGVVPAQLSSRLARFESVRLDIERPDGKVIRRVLPMADFAARGHMRLAVDLPDAGTPARRITVEFIGPTVASLLSEARLDPQPRRLIGGEQLWIAMLCGVLLVPLFFNLALFRVLRERFLLWHVAVVGFLLTHTLVTSGFAALVGGVPVGTLAILNALTFCGGAASAIMMASDFIEVEALDHSHRRALRISALWLVFNAGFFLATVDWLQGPGLNIYFANWAAVVAIIVWCLGTALARGSRSTKFLVLSWLPLILTGLWQIGEGLFDNQTEPMALFVVQRFAIGLEVLIGSIGVADRFIQLRRDRDDHRYRAGEMARLAERDPLTGLLNRRAIEGRYAALRQDGFTTLALLDLDHFKAVNDRFGHAMGDQVLQSVASSLPEDGDALALRMGGEEFMLVLRGKGAAQRAERVRQAITARVARDIAGLDRPITASMGLVEIPAEVMPEATFAAIYARADGLLYQAKSAGRNRMASERMTAFARRPLGKRGTAAA